MGIIVRELDLYGSRGKRRITALFDSGSSKSFIRRDLGDTIGTPVELPEPERFEMARGSFKVTDGFVGSVILEKTKLAHLFRAVEGLTEELILGADFLQQWDVHLDPRRKKITVDPRALRLRAVSGRQRR